MAFVIGLGLTSFRSSPQSISLCKLETHPSLYAGKSIRFRAVVQRTRSFVSAVSVCDDNSAPAVSLDLDADELARFALSQSSTSSSSDSDKAYLMDAVIAGQLDPHFGQGCFAPRYHIFNARVEKVISIQEFENSSQAVEWVKFNSQ